MSDGGCGNGEAEMQQLPTLFKTLKTFTIGFSAGCDRKKLENMAKLANGEFHFGTDGAQLKNAFETIFRVHLVSHSSVYSVKNGLRY